MDEKSMIRKPACATLAVVVAVFLIASPAHARPGPGQLVAAFNPVLTGDPLVDFTRAVAQGETFTIYLISGVLPESVAGYRFGFEISKAASVAFDHSAAPALTITPPLVPVKSVSWGVVKVLYDSP